MGMIHKTYLISLVALIILFMTNTCGEMKIKWSELASLPPSVPGSIQPGVAGPFSGVTENILLVAGGANFENEMPWHGGKKSYHMEVYALDLSANDGLWFKNGPIDTLPVGVAYGASATVPDGVICMGGETENGITDQVFIISIQGDKVNLRQLPVLPLPLSNAASAAIGRVVYIAGGISPEGPSSALYCLDTQNTENGWMKLNDLPLPLINSIMVASGGKNKFLWIFGGRTRGKEDDTSRIRCEIFKYSPDDNQWMQAGVLSSDGKDTLRLAAGTGAVVDDRHIAIFGGNDGLVFNKVEKLLSEMSRENDSAVLERMRYEYIALQESHPGFVRDVLLFNTENNDCLKVGEMPGPAQVTTVAIASVGGIIIPSGEIRPGIRTSEIRFVRFK